MASFREVVTSKGERRWEFQVRKRGLQRTGRARTFQNAQTLARKAEDALDLQIATGITGDKTVADAIRRYLKTEIGGHADSDRRNLEARLAWWVERIGTARLGNLRPSTIRRAWEKLEASPGTCNRYLANLSKVLGMAAREWEWLPANPCRALRRRRESPGRVRMLTDEQRTDLLAACRSDVNPRLYPIVVFALRTGCRLGEIETLRAADVDADQAQAWIARSKNGEARFVHLHSEVLAAMEAATARPRPDGRVFGTLPKRAWERARETAKLEDWHFHDLRHDFASRLGRRGLSAPQIAAALGHKTWVMSQKYVHTASSDARDIIRSLD